jgi:hypothetical protein
LTIKIFSFDLASRSVVLRRRGVLTVLMIEFGESDEEGVLYGGDDEI